MPDTVYNSLNSYYRSVFGARVHKVSVKADFSCPNRDGTKATGGCIFCSADNLTPATYKADKSISEQIESGIAFLKSRYKVKNFIAYFQDFSATYDNPQRLESLYREALNHPEVCGLAVGTRPDCLSHDTIGLLKNIARETFVQLELGLQSANEETLRKINRGHSLEEYKTSHSLALKAGLHVVSHIILGFPWETKDDHSRTIELLNELKTPGIKFHCLHVIRNTVLEQMYNQTPFPLPSEEEYTEEVIRLLELLNPETVVHRLTGETTRELLVAPDWVLHKTSTVSKLKKTMLERGTYQGRLFKG